ncbi:MAG: glycerate kinase [Desulfobacterales bacterium]|jgi:glycerate kinase
MKIVIAPNAFKGCLTAAEAGRAMASGVNQILPDAELTRVPVADGGDGLVDVAIEALGGEPLTVSVTGPRFDPVEATYCRVDALSMATVEMALASGLALLSEDQRDPTQTTTLGTGEVIRAALDLKVHRIAVGIGGSATNDGGIGMATALGVRFLDEAGSPVAPVGAELRRIRRIDMSGRDRRVEKVRIEAVCDVDNPLCGPHGAAHVYGPQKGATPEQAQQLDDGLANLADVIERELGIAVGKLPGSGAAGGLGAGLHAFLGAELRRGVDLVLDLVDLDAKLAGADLVLTGEGQIDFQTAFGKAPAGVAQRAQTAGVPCLAIAGSIGDDLGNLHAIGMDAIFSLTPGPMPLKAAMRDAGPLLRAATAQVLRCFLAAGSRGH